MFQSQLFKIFISLIVVALFLQASVYLYLNKKDAQEILSGGLDYQKSGVEINLAHIQPPSDKSSKASQLASLPPIIQKTACFFPTEQTAIRLPVIFGEIVWMGSALNHNDESISLKLSASSSAARVDISGWSILNQSERLFAFIPDQTALTDYRPEFILKRGSDYQGILRNSDEGLRLFDKNCDLIDEVFANPSWPAGDNERKISMKRAADLSWYTEPPSAAPAALPTIMPTPTPTITLVPTTPPADEAVVLSDSPAGGADGEESKDIIGIQIIAIQASSEASPTDEYVKLYNSGDNDIDLNNWKLTKKTESGKEYILVSSAKFQGVIRAQNYFIIAHKNYSGPAGLYYSNNSNSLANENNSVLLYNEKGNLTSQKSY